MNKRGQVVGKGKKPKKGSKAIKSKVASKKSVGKKMSVKENVSTKKTVTPPMKVAQSMPTQSNSNQQQTMPQKKQESGSSVPAGVKIISILYIIGAVIGVLIGIALFVGAGFISTLATQVPILAILGGGLIIVGGVIFIGFAILELLIGLGLWKGQQWARIVAIVFAVIGGLFAIIAIFNSQLSSIVSLVIHAVIGIYLLFSKSVKAAFS